MCLRRVFRFVFSTSFQAFSASFPSFVRFTRRTYTTQLQPPVVVWFLDVLQIRLRPDQTEHVVPYVQVVHCMSGHSPGITVVPRLVTSLQTFSAAAAAEIS